MSFKKALPLLLAGLLLAPMANAATTITVPGATSETPVEIPSDAAGSIDVDVTIDCQDFITGAQDTEIDVPLTVSGVDWISSEGVTATFAGADCITGLAGGNTDMTLTETVTLPLMANMTAPGMVPTEISVDDADGNSGTATIQVAYKKGYTFTVETDFPAEVMGEPMSLNATMHLFANSRTMAMFQVLEKPQFVSVTGIPEFKTYQDDALGGDKEMMVPLTITVTPPETGDWESDKLVFKTWSHFLDDGAMKTDDVTYEWTFTNAAAGSTEKKDSPGVDVVVLTLGLLGAALVAARRRV